MQPGGNSVDIVSSSFELILQHKAVTVVLLQVCWVPEAVGVMIIHGPSSSWRFILHLRFFGDVSSGIAAKSCRLDTPGTFHFNGVKIYHFCRYVWIEIP